MTLTIPATTTVGHVEQAIAYLMEHVPDAVSDLGRSFHQSKLDHIRERDARLAEGKAAVQDAAMQRAYGGKQS